jgi:predicted ATPase/DNA-binding winged helix-turn-helix (wHTH) protein
MAAKVADPSVSTDDGTFSFGPFRLQPEQQLLSKAGQPVSIGSRALELLIALVERAGETVTKEQLLARAWPSTSVDETSLRAQIKALRRALEDGRGGCRYVLNIPGRGYRFVAPVTRSDAESGPGIAVRINNLPRRLTQPIGRDGIIGTVATRLQQQRLITIVGPGGIGKTTVAVAVANRLLDTYKDGIAFIDLGPLAAARMVAGAIATALGLAVIAQDPSPGLIAFLRDRHMLLVLDNCEHVVETAAVLAEELLRATFGVHILATSREPLRAEGEVVHRLPPLETPPSSGTFTAADALAFSSVRLFVERAAASAEGFELSDENAAGVAYICRRLDGIALAIELAAGRLDAFGVRRIAALLDDRFRLLTHGRRTALPRHQTLRATFDWSYEILPESERAVLRRVGIFAGDFTLEAAAAVVAFGSITTSQAAEGVANLVAKSLIVRRISDGIEQYRLLDTTRAYARERLRDSGETGRFARRLAEYLRGLFERAAVEIETRPRAQWLAAYGPHLDNLRAALGWAFSRDGDAGIGVALTAAAVPLWTHLSLNEECRSRVETALTNLAADPEGGARRDMELHAALAAAAHYTTMGPERSVALARTLHLAEELEDNDYRLRALWGLWTDHINRGQLRSALDMAQRFAAAAGADPGDSPIADRMIGLSLYFLGDQTNARVHIERMLARYVAPTPDTHVIRFQFDQRVAARVSLAEVLWLLGFPEKAMRMVESGLDDARASGHKLSISYALAASACPVALHVGDLGAVERFVALLEQPASHALSPWLRWARCYKGVVLIRRGDIAQGLETLQAGLGGMPEGAFHMRYTAFLGELADALGAAGAAAHALETIDRALGRSERHEERWCTAELLRIKGRLLLLAGEPGASTAAEDLFRRSLDLAREQRALSWELRIAIDLTRLKADQGRPADAGDLLRCVYDRFSEGFETADLQRAKRLLDQLARD